MASNSSSSSSIYVEGATVAICITCSVAGKLTGGVPSIEDYQF
jgi:hypothetical protein